MYKPDLWMIVKFNEGTDNKVYYRVLASWQGGYLDGDSWRMNSGITKAEQEGDYTLFHGSSGSIYRCHKKSYGGSAYACSILQLMRDKQPSLNMTVMSSETNFLELEYE